jgi:hypothetical protein
MAHGKNSVFSIDDTATTLQDISTKVTNVSGLPGSVEMAENTTFGSESKTYEPGLGDAQVSVECVWDSVLDGYLGTKTQWKAATRSFEYGPDGGTAGKVKYSGEAYISNVDIPAPVGDIIKATITLQVSGDVTVGTY